MLKKSQLPFSIFLFFLISFSSACTNDWGTRGEGPIVTERRSLPEFQSIENAVGADIILTQGRQKEVVIEAQQNVLNELKTEVQNGRLEIEFDKNVGRHDGIKLYITIPVISEVSLSGSGSVRSENELKGDELKVNISGSGNMDIQARYERLKSVISGSGDMNLAGRGEYLEVQISGSGNVQAVDFEAEEAIVRISGSGGVEVDVEESLDVSIAGSGDLKYKGRPVVKSSTSGSGSVSPIH